MAAWAKALGFDDTEIIGLMRCVCKWPNYLRGVCLVCNHKEFNDDRNVPVDEGGRRLHERTIVPEYNAA